MKRCSFLVIGLFLCLRLSAQVTVSEIFFKGDGASEAVEVAGLEGANIDGWELLLYDGFTGAVYDSHTFSGRVVIPFNN